ncbi:hypothetical protein Tco_0988477 [Tanacetum coccineum]|uniref:Secreted protein n=1 Tax=Tanacetum coccineum TaxID=301880 RepID=A0ABQ5ERJ0_9ASTR
MFQRLLRHLGRGNYLLLLDLVVRLERVLLLLLRDRLGEPVCAHTESIAVCRTLWRPGSEILKRRIDDVFGEGQLRVSYRKDRVAVRDEIEDVAASWLNRSSRVRNGSYASNGSGPRPAQTARECSYSEFLKCKPLDFKGTEGVNGHSLVVCEWSLVFSIGNCTASYVKSNLRLALCKKTMLLHGGILNVRHLTPKQLLPFHGQPLKENDD